MIELRYDSLRFSFPDVHPDAGMRVSFMRTLRIPDDGGDYPLPPGLGRFPVRHVDDHADRVPPVWLERGGVMLPMYQSEALWLDFESNYAVGRGSSYPFAVKVAAGKVNAVTGEEWRGGLHQDPQDYLSLPEQPWLDGYCVEKGVVRQFVAMPLGAGYSAEEQLTGEAEHGGIQVMACPMKREVFERRFPVLEDRGGLRFARDPAAEDASPTVLCCAASGAMGLAPGGRMKQEVFDDPFDPDDWDLENTSRCFVHLANSLVWRSVTGFEPPATPATAEEYTRRGLPWFDYYGEGGVAAGSEALAGLKSVAQMAKETGDAPLPENQPVDPQNIVKLRAGLREGQVREGAF